MVREAVWTKDVCKSTTFLMTDIKRERCYLERRFIIKVWRTQTVDISFCAPIAIGLRSGCMTMAIKDRVTRAVQNVLSGGTASTFFNMFQGRCTFAALCFSTAGVYGWLHGRDLTSFALFVTAVQGLLVLHSWKEDIAEQQDVRHERQNLLSKEEHL